MGILGLTSFIDHNPYLLTDFELHDTRLIIDGNNLYHFLYYYYNVPYEYGGDYNIYGDKIRQFFENLKECNVIPYVIFDGAYEKDDRKLQTSLQRARDRTLVVNYITNFGKGKMLPILAGDVFRRVLDELSVKHATCITEADSHIAALAIEWKCPVLSNDSDFCIYNIDSGFILLDYIDLNVHRKQITSNVLLENYKYLRGQIFYQTKLLCLFRGLQFNHIPLLATIMGNDIVQSKTFENFISSSHFTRSVPPMVVIAKRHARIIKLLQWLQSISDVDKAVEIIIHYIPKEQQSSTRMLIDKSVATYSNLSTDLHLYFENGCECPSVSVQSFGGNELPHWFITGIRQGQIGVYLLNVITLRRHILLTQMENITQSSSHLIAKPLRQAIYTLLLSIDKPCCEFNSNSEKLFMSVKEYDREGKNQKQNIISLSENTLPLFHDLYNMPINLKQQLFAKICKADISKVQKFPTDLQLLVCVISYWFAASRPNEYSLLAIWLSIYKVAGLDKSNCLMEHNDRCNYSLSANIQRKCSYGSIQTAIYNLSKFALVPKHNRAKPFNTSLLHCYAEFQSCLCSVIHLYQLLCIHPNSQFNLFLNNDDFKQINECYNSTYFATLFLNGTLIYNLTRELRSRKYPVLYIEEQLGRSSDISAYFIELYCQLKMLIETSCKELSSDLFPDEIALKHNKRNYVENYSVDTDNVHDIASNCDESKVDNCMKDSNILTSENNDQVTRNRFHLLSNDFN